MSRLVSPISIKPSKTKVLSPSLDSSPDGLEELFSSTFYQASVGMVHVRMSDGRFVRANHKICEMLGYTEEEFCSRTIPEVTHPDDVLTDLDNTRRMILGEINTFSIEKRLIRKNGTPIWVRLSAVSVVRNASGQVTYGMAVCEDISQVKEAEQALQESEDRFRTMAEAAPVCIYVTDVQPQCIYVNQNWLTYTGVSFEDSIGLKWRECIHPDDLDDYLDTFARAFEQHRDFRTEVRVKKADGAYGWMVVTGVPRYTPNGHFLGYIGTALDITDHKNAEAAMQQARLLAEDASRKKSEFLSKMSHELRTPLNSIIGFSEIIGTGQIGNLNPQQKEFLSYVIASSRHLLNLINDLLDIARIESGKMLIQPCQVEIQGLLDSVQAMMTPLAAQKDVTLDFQVQPEIGEVHLDPDRFRQILVNLIGNAIKFNQPGGTIFVRLCKTEDNCLTGEVQDTGIGIPKEKLPDIFDKFFQVETRPSRNHGGSGLGLAITKELILLHNGSIFVDSQEGIGSTFTFSIPLLTCTDGKIQPGERADHEQRKARHPHH